MYTAKDAAVSIVLNRLFDACGSPCDDLLDASYITAQLYINLVATIPQADDSASRPAKRGVRAQVVLMIGRRVEERFPSGVCESCVGCEVHGGIVVEGRDRPPAVVKVLCIPGCDGCVGESIVEDSIEASGGGDIFCQTVADYQIG